jgi:hypothetical protein
MPDDNVPVLLTYPSESLLPRAAVEKYATRLRALNMTPLELAKLFHETFTRLAPNYGYERNFPDFDPDTPNGQTMIAVCDEIMAKLGLDAMSQGPEPTAR